MKSTEDAPSSVVEDEVKEPAVVEAEITEPIAGMRETTDEGARFLPLYISLRSTYCDLKRSLS